MSKKVISVLLCLTLSISAIGQQFRHRTNVLNVDSLFYKRIPSKRLLKQYREINLVYIDPVEFHNIIRRMPHLKVIWFENSYYDFFRPWYVNSREFRYRLSIKSKLQSKIEEEALTKQNRILSSLLNNTAPDTLRSIDLSFCYLEKIPEILYQCKNLENLNLSGNKISELPKDVKMRLKKLKNLNIENNYIIPEMIYLPKNLVSLNLGTNSIWRLTSKFTKRAKKLKTLVLSGNSKLKFKGKHFRHFKNIENLALSSCALSEADIFLKRKIEYLDLSNNNIHSVPNRLFSYSTNLSLANNKITEITLPQNPEIKINELNLRKNPIVNLVIPETVSISRLNLDEVGPANKNNLILTGKIETLIIRKGAFELSDFKKSKPMMKVIESTL